MNKNEVLSGGYMIMIINSNEFIEYVKRHLLKNNSHNEWNAKIDRMYSIGVLNYNTYQTLKMIVSNT